MLELSVCIGSACHIKGSYNVIQTFQHLIEEKGLNEKIDFKATFCMKECQCKGVGVSIGEEKYHVMPEKAREFFNETVLPAVL